LTFSNKKRSIKFGGAELDYALVCHQSSVIGEAAAALLLIQKQQIKN
jgi:hypothetical protein